MAQIASRLTIKVCLCYSSEDARPSLLGLCTADEKNTAEAVDSEGWVHTGDIAEIDACGRIKIIDRVKVSSLGYKIPCFSV